MTESLFKSRFEAYTHKMFAFIKRDFLIYLSYRLHFVFGWLTIVISVAIFYYIAKLFGEGNIPYLKNYGGEYFPFVFMGIVLSGYLVTALKNFSANIRREQMMGTLEAMLVTPTKLSAMIIATSLWSFIFSSISALIYILFGIWFLGLNLTNTSFFNTIIILIVTVIPFSSIGIISAGFIMVFKMGDPIALAISLFSILFGGVYFPIAILPNGLRAISYLLPITYSLRALRHALLQDYTFNMLLPDITILLVFSIILLPLSILIFKYAVRRAKEQGSLVQY